MTTMNAELYDALISANVSDDQARKAAVSVTSIVGYPPIDEIATKADLQEIKADMATKADVEALRLETKADIEGVKKDIEVLRLETKADIEGVKKDIEVLRLETKTDIEGVKKDIEALRLATEVKIKEAENRLIIWNMGIVGVGIAILKLIL